MEGYARAAARIGQHPIRPEAGFHFRVDRRPRRNPGAGRARAPSSTSISRCVSGAATWARCCAALRRRMGDDPVSRRRRSGSRSRSARLASFPPHEGLSPPHRRRRGRPAHLLLHGDRAARQARPGQLGQNLPVIQPKRRTCLSKTDPSPLPARRCCSVRQYSVNMCAGYFRHAEDRGNGRSTSAMASDRIGRGCISTFWRQAPAGVGQGSGRGSQGLQGRHPRHLRSAATASSTAVQNVQQSAPPPPRDQSSRSRARQEARIRAAGLPTSDSAMHTEFQWSCTAVIQRHFTRPVHAHRSLCVLAPECLRRSAASPRPAPAPFPPSAGG